MAASRYRFNEGISAEDAHAFSWQVQPDERIGPEPAARRKEGVLAFAIAALILIGTGMALLDDRVRAPEMVNVPAGTRSAASPPAEPPAPGPAVPELPRSAVQAVPDPGGARESDPADPTGPTADTAEDTGPPEPLPPPPVNKDDPYQIKALAAGLHPGLSRVLLMRLTPEDYRNAGIAVRTALTETKDGDAHIWPKQPAPGLAQFRVHFVRGAVDCRRYVVTVNLDRWATTALPMEKCGARLVEPKPRQ